MSYKSIRALILFVFVIAGGSFASGQRPLSESQESARLVQLERKVDDLERKTKSAPTAAASAGVLSFLFGAFCALWAQNSRRSAFLWFFLGLFFSVFAVLVVLVKNANDRFDRQQRERYTGASA